MKRRSAGQTCAMLGMLLALALLCGYIESLIPISFGVPGIKLGLPNLVVVITLYLLGPKEALVVSVARILLSGFLYGTMFGVVYGLAGGIFSFFIMLCLLPGDFFLQVIQYFLKFLIRNHIDLIHPYYPFCEQNARNHHEQQQHSRIKPTAVNDPPQFFMPHLLFHSFSCFCAV